MFLSCKYFCPVPEPKQNSPVSHGWGPDVSSWDYSRWYPWTWSMTTLWVSLWRTEQRLLQLFFQSEQVELKSDGGVKIIFYKTSFTEKPVVLSFCQRSERIWDFVWTSGNRSSRFLKLTVFGIPISDFDSYYLFPFHDRKFVIIFHHTIFNRNSEWLYGFLL